MSSICESFSVDHDGDRHLSGADESTPHHDNRCSIALSVQNPVLFWLRIRYWTGFGTLSPALVRV